LGGGTVALAKGRCVEGRGNPKNWTRPAQGKKRKEGYSGGTKNAGSLEDFGKKEWPEKKKKKISQLKMNLARKRAKKPANLEKSR